MKDFKKGLFVVTVGEKSRIALSDVKKKVGRFTLERVEVTLVGTLKRKRGELLLSARGSGTAFRLARDSGSKKDWLADAKELETQGSRLVRASGTLSERKVRGTKAPVQFIELSSVKKEPAKRR